MPFHPVPLCQGWGDMGILWGRVSVGIPAMGTGGEVSAVRLCCVLSTAICQSEPHPGAAEISQQEHGV